MLKLENINKQFKNKIIFNNVSYEFENGIYILMGHNGSGKSTLFKIISGIDQKYNGNIISSNLFYLPEKMTLPKDIKVYDFLNHYIKINQSYANFTELCLNYYLENKLIKSLSKGMIQKVGIIMSLLDKYDVILYDEPLEGLDEESINIFVNDIKKIKDTTIVISLHEIPKGLRLNAKKIYIKEGKLCEELKN